MVQFNVLYQVNQDVDATMRTIRPDLKSYVSLTEKEIVISNSEIQERMELLREIEVFTQLEIQFIKEITDVLLRRVSNKRFKDISLQIALELKTCLKAFDVRPWVTGTRHYKSESEIKRHLLYTVSYVLEYLFSDVPAFANQVAIIFLRIYGNDYDF